MKLTISVCLLYVAMSAMNTGKAMGRTACLPCIFKNHLDALDLKRFKPVTKNLLNRLDQEVPIFSKHKLLHYHEQQRIHQQQVDAARMRDLEDGTDTELTGVAQARTGKWRKQRHDKRYVSCEYGARTSGIRHARAAIASDPYTDRAGSANKRHSAFSDLTLCHFKICNMGRKRATRSDQN